MTVPYSFGSATSAIPLSQLDSNFNTPITLGNTAIQLGNTVTTLNNMTLANVTVSSGTITLTDITASGNVTLSGGTANGVAYLNGSKVVTTGSALRFDGTNLGIAGTGRLEFATSGGTFDNYIQTVNSFNMRLFCGRGSTSYAEIATDSINFGIGGSEQMRLTSTGLGIGTSSPGYKLDVQAAKCVPNFQSTTGTNPVYQQLTNTGGTLYVGRDGSTGGDFGVGAYASAIWSTGAYPLVFATNGAEKMRLDSSGNLGLGVTPSAWGTLKAVQVKNTAWSSDGNVATLTGNSYYDGSNFRYVANGAACYHQINNAGGFNWNIAASGTAGAIPSFTQAMTLDASGNLGVGTTSPSTRLHVIGTVGGEAVRVTDNTNSTLKILNQSGGLVTFQSDGAINFQTNGANDRARIDSSGYFKLAGNTSLNRHEIWQVTAGAYTATIGSQNGTAANCYGVQVYYSSAAPNGTGNEFFLCVDNAATRATIRSNGGIANYQANDVNLSDRREKINFAPSKSYLDVVCAIPVQTFNYIDQSEDDPGLTLGVVAQDVQAVAPELVSESNWGTKEEPKMRLSIYQTDLQYALMKCIQEQQSIIETLTARITALEGK